VDRQSSLYFLINQYIPAPPAPFSGGAVPTMSAVGPDAVTFLDKLETIEPGLHNVSKRWAPQYTVADVAVLSRPLFDPSRFSVGIYFWRPDRRYLTQDIILGSTVDGSLVYHSGRWPGMPASTVWRDILRLGDDAAATGDFGAYQVGGDTYLADHRIANPSSSQFATDIWQEIDAARLRSQRGP
jgi:hypothetical protein